jgi:hypothetical protein
LRRFPFPILIPSDTHAKTPHTRLHLSMALLIMYSRFDSDVTFIAVGHRIIGLMPWRIVEIHGKEVRSGPRWVGEVLSGMLGHA